MSGKRRRLHYWDSCIFFAWIKQETCWPEEVTRGIEQEIEQAYSKELIIVTSVLTLNEVLQSQMSKEQKERYQGIFHHPSLQLVEIDRRIASDAAVIREAHDTRVFDRDGNRIAGCLMSMGDSFHLATAIRYEVNAFKTLDGSSRHKRQFDLLALNGNVALSRLAVNMPKYVPPPEPLKGPVLEIQGTQADLFANTEIEKVEERNAAGAEERASEFKPAGVRGGGDGHPQGEARAETAEQKASGKEAGKE
jgi:predicted nucleic acid-binding protein